MKKYCFHFRKTLHTRTEKQKRRKKKKRNQKHPFIKSSCSNKSRNS